MKDKILIVEGKLDKQVIPYLVEQNGIPWGENSADWVVDIKEFGGIDKILDEDSLRTEFKQPGLKSFGIMVDADENAKSRWHQIRDRLRNFLGKVVPDRLPKEGLVFDAENGVRVGVWLMPDNRSAGMLETFLSKLIIDPSKKSLWGFAVQALEDAKKHGASYKDCHRDKARIHTYLAWQDEPGKSFQVSIKRGIFVPDSPPAQAFIDWFRKLYLFEKP